MSGLANELLKMCSDVCFDMYAAEKIIQRVELNQEIIDTQRPNSRTSYLSVATQSANVEMVRLLLQKGANPNFVLYGDKPLWRENPFGTYNIVFLENLQKIVRLAYRWHK